MLRRLSVLGTGMAVAAGAAGLAPAAAAIAATSVPPLTKQSMFSASIRVSDLPASFGSDPKRSLSYSSGAKTDPFEMCVDKDGHKVFGAKPLERANSAIPLSQTGSGNNITASVAVSSDIFGYASARAANKQWRALKKATKRCAAALNKRIDVSGAAVNANVYQQRKVLGRVCGREGFRIAQRVEVDVASGAQGGLTIYVGGYSVYRQVGTTILRVQFANYTQTSAAASRIKPKWSAFARSEATRIAHRVAASPIR